VCSDLMFHFMLGVNSLQQTIAFPSPPASGAAYYTTAAVYPVPSPTVAVSPTATR
jgi:hypothetical protein